MAKNSLTIYLDPELIERIRVAAKSEDRSISNFLDRGIRARLLPGDSVDVVAVPLEPSHVGDELADPYSVSGRQVDIEELVAQKKKTVRRHRRNAK